MIYTKDDYESSRAVQICLTQEQKQQATVPYRQYENVLSDILELFEKVENLETQIKDLSRRHKPWWEK